MAVTIKKMTIEKIEEMRKGLHKMVDAIVELSQRSDYDLKVSISRNVIKKPTDYGMMGHKPGDDRLITIIVGPAYLVNSVNESAEEAHKIMEHLHDKLQ